MPDREKVISWVEGLAEDDWRLFHSDSEVQNIAKAVLALLKEQEAVVRCKDCKHYMTMHCNCGGCFISDDWYCADGERR